MNGPRLGEVWGMIVALKSLPNLVLRHEERVTEEWHLTPGLPGRSTIWTYYFSWHTHANFVFSQNSPNPCYLKRVITSNISINTEFVRSARFRGFITDLLNQQLHWNWICIESVRWTVLRYLDYRSCGFWTSFILSPIRMSTARREDIFAILFSSARIWLKTQAESWETLCIWSYTFQCSHRRCIEY